MDYTYKSDNKIGIYTLSGTLLGETDGMRMADDVNERLEEGVRKFVLEISGLKHINSSGLGVFITLLTRTRKKDGEIVILNPSEFIRNLMMITKLNSIFNIFEDEAKAMAFLKDS